MEYTKISQDTIEVKYNINKSELLSTKESILKQIDEECSKLRERLMANSKQQLDFIEEQLKKLI